MFEIEHGFAEFDNYRSEIQISMPFTYLDWKLSHDIKSG